MKEDEIDVPVVIHVGGNHRDAGRFRACHAENIGDVSKAPVAVVAEHAVAVSTAHVKIKIAVVVVVEEGRGDAARGSYRLCCFLKLSLPQIAEKLARSNQVDVRQTVVVIVTERRARTAGTRNSGAV